MNDEQRRLDISIDQFTGCLTAMALWLVDLTPVQLERVERVCLRLAELARRELATRARGPLGS